MKRIMLIGAGAISAAHWIPSILRSASLALRGVVDPDEGARRRASEAAPGIQTFARGNDIPASDVTGSIALVATPDHFPVIQELAGLGFREFIVEKPIVARDAEVEKLGALATQKKLKIYSIDHYYLKFLALEFTLGRLTGGDPRAKFLEFRGDHKPEEISNILGAVEGVTYTNIEAGDLGIPTLDTRPWIEHDPELGGMLRDLGTHAFGPLMRAGLLAPEADIADVGLAKFTKARDGFEPARSKNDIEMWVRALMVSNGITVNVAFGKAPFPGKERSLAVRAANGVFFAGLARGQSSVLMTNDGRTTRISLKKAESDLVLEEAISFFTGKLPAHFDGNLNASLGALRLNQRLRAKYWETVR